MGYLFKYHSVFRGQCSRINYYNITRSSTSISGFKMHIVYKLIALSVVFGLVLAGPTAQIAPRSYDDDFSNDFADLADVTEDKDTNESRTLDLILPGLNLLGPLLVMVPKFLGAAGIKAKVIAAVVALIKKLAPKAILVAIGAIATFAFCKFTNLCSLAYDPVVYDMVPPQVRSFVTPETLENAQQYLMSAMQQFENQEFDS
ncbi:hypothetical protein NE865_03400 [Phthorimaea operculella]|nr:hypothetical protein NE865_03400 [Phthorimaea operculella]